MATTTARSAESRHHWLVRSTVLAGSGADAGVWVISALLALPLALSDSWLGFFGVGLWLLCAWSAVDRMRTVFPLLRHGRLTIGRLEARRVHRERHQESITETYEEFFVYSVDGATHRISEVGVSTLDAHESVLFLPSEPTVARVVARLPLAVSPDDDGGVQVQLRWWYPFVSLLPYASLVAVVWTVVRWATG